MTIETDDVMKVAIVHDYLLQRGGAERVVLLLAQGLPDARIFTHGFRGATTFAQFSQFKVTVGPLDRALRESGIFSVLIPLVTRFLPVTGAQIEVVSTSGWAHAWPKGSGKRVTYVHSPARWLYAFDDFRKGQHWLIVLAMRILGPALRRWDRRAMRCAGIVVANSRVSQRRIREAYGLDVPVVHPPVSRISESLSEVVGLPNRFILHVARSRGYKNASLAAQAVEALGDCGFVCVGGLPLRDTPWPADFLGLVGVSDEELAFLYESAEALVATAHEDFGLTPLEAAHYGTGTVAIAQGGYLETIVPDVTGVLVDESTPEAVAAGIVRLRQLNIPSESLRAHAERFSTGRFIHELLLLSE